MYVEITSYFLEGVKEPKTYAIEQITCIFIVNFEWVWMLLSIISIVNFESANVYWTNSECYFFNQKLRLKIWSKWRTDDLYQSRCFSQETQSQVFMLAKSVFLIQSNLCEEPFLCKNS